VKLFEPHASFSWLVLKLIKKAEECRAAHPECSQGSHGLRRNCDLSVGSEAGTQGFVPALLEPECWTSVECISKIR